MCITCAYKASAPNFNICECVWGEWGGGVVFIPPRNSPTLAGCPGIQLNSDTIQSQHQIAQASILDPIASLGCYLCF